jgi:dihydroxy-acid dehydratase
VPIVLQWPALSMNCLAEALGMSLPGCGAIPAPYRERAQMAYLTGRRIVAMVDEDLTPRKIMTKRAFENTIVVSSAIAASSNAPIHVNAIARHAGVELTNDDWQRVGRDISIIVNCQPAGEYLGEDFHRAGGIPAVMNVLLAAGKIRGDVLTVSGRSIAENVRNSPPTDANVIFPYDKPVMANAGSIVMSGNLFRSAFMKTSVISESFRARYLSDPKDPEAFVGRAIVFEGPEDYHARIDDPELQIDERCILVMRNCGPLGYPGSAEVVNMQPPTALLKRGIKSLPTMGDGRQSGTADSPSIVNAAPESAAGGNLAILRTGDRIRIDLRKARVDVLISDDEIAARRKALPAPALQNQTPWQELYRATVGQLDGGGCLEAALKYQDLVHLRGLPRHSH